MSDRHLTEIPFTDFDLPDSLLEGIQAAGFTHCTPIQAETLPLVLSGQDVAGQAQTGTGKSAAFLLATFNWLLKHPAAEDRRSTQPRAVILAPTRELAVQIHKDACVLGESTGLRLVLVYGGTGYESQRRALEQGVDILIGTPGRTIDYYKQKVFDLKAVQVMVLDEADRMFDLGFIKDVRYLLRGMPPCEQRLNLLFSATLSHRVNELAYEHMNNPEVINVAPDTKIADKVSQTLYHSANNEKMGLLVGLLRKMDPHRTLVFTNTKRAAESVQDWLQANGFHAQVISGDVPQQKRQKLLQEFSTGKLPILVATDVAARGLHIPDVSHVINYDLPQDAEDYVHRIGRTARAGSKGDAVSFACETYAYSLMDIENYIGHKIPVGQITSDLLPELQQPERRSRSSRRQHRDTGPDKARNQKKQPARKKKSAAEKNKGKKQQANPSGQSSDPAQSPAQSTEAPRPRRRTKIEIPAVG